MGFLDNLQTANMLRLSSAAIPSPAWQGAKGGKAEDVHVWRVKRSPRKTSP